MDEEKISLAIDKAQLVPDKKSNIKTPLSLSGSIVYDASSRSIHVSQLRFSGFDMSTAASGVLSLPASNLITPEKIIFAGHIDMDGHPDQILSSFCKTLPPHKSALGAVLLSSDVKISSNQLQLNNLHGKIHDTDYSGHIVAKLSPQRLSGDIKFNDLHLDTAKKIIELLASQPYGQVSPLRWPQTDLQLSADRILWNNAVIKDAACRLAGKGGIYEFNPLSCSIAGGKVISSIKASMLPTSPVSARMHVNISASQADMADLSKYLPWKSLFEGTCNVNVFLEWTTSNALSSLSGKGSVTSTNIKLKVPLFPSQILSENSAEPYKEDLLCSFNMYNGTMSFSSCSLTSSGISMAGTGKLDLRRKTINASGTLVNGNKTAYPVSLTGNIFFPSYSLGNAQAVPDDSFRFQLSFPELSKKERSHNAD